MEILNDFNSFAYMYTNNIYIKKNQKYPIILSLIKEVYTFLNIFIIPYYKIQKQEVIIEQQEVIIEPESEITIEQQEVIIEQQEVTIEQQEVIIEPESEITIEQQEVTIEQQEVIIEPESEVTIEPESEVTIEQQEVTIEQQEVIIEPEPEVNIKLVNKNLIIRPPRKSLNDRNIYNNISIIDDNLLPSIELNLVEAILEIKKNPKCLPLNAYIERWNTLKNKKNKTKNKKEPVVDDKLLPELNLSLPLAIHKIKTNPKCVPFDLYIKRWNELKISEKYIKNIKDYTRNKF